MDWKKEIEGWHKGFYEVSVYRVDWVSPDKARIQYYAEARPHGSAFLKPAIIRTAVFVDGAMLDDEDF